MISIHLITDHHGMQFHSTGMLVSSFNTGIMSATVYCISYNKEQVAKGFFV